MAEPRKRPRRLTIAWSWLALALLGCGEEPSTETDAMLAPSQRADGGAPHEGIRSDEGRVFDAATRALDADVRKHDTDAARASGATHASGASDAQQPSALDATSAPNVDERPHSAAEAGREALVDPVVAAACNASSLYEVPEDPSARGPWPVGVKSVSITLAGVAVPMTTEVWYPAMRGSEVGKLAERYDLTALLPSGQASKLRPEDSLAQRCDCYRELPVDSAHGPYPAVIYVHGTGSFRTASLSLMTHWASRGFIVIAADHLGLFVQDFLAASSSVNVRARASRPISPATSTPSSPRSRAKRGRSPSCALRSMAHASH